MGRLSKRSLHLKKISQLSVKSRQEVIKNKNKEINNANELVDNEINRELVSNSNNELPFSKLLSNHSIVSSTSSPEFSSKPSENTKSYARSKRPLSYLGNSIRTRQRKKSIGRLDAEKNGSTLDNFFSTEKNLQINENDMNSHNDLIEESNAVEINLVEHQKHEVELRK
ncbi:7125_t:CDS:2 [Entrophospora sp. SA101]|nr:11169_t:CDS:2 [Entrophospora sp. SA101]CAJ0766955.1 7125_t:CDS:2 [Entrophospora sp. SA101]CAJ0823616.1 16582_t:CDS:2 [Entrophospora sp. SA101]CAJ0836686.1 17780_t:CDS:2 [Entrophospora sp. SA101]CAJ0905006.1 5728_t:CDS:2 [Entrophospora sp. SA101]